MAGFNRKDTHFQSLAGNIRSGAGHPNTFITSDDDTETGDLFLDNSKQVLNYAIFRWGVPLVVPLLLERDGSNLVEYLEQWPSSEIMSRQLKDHERYGLGKAIGDKAAHLFAKWYVQTLGLVKRSETSWGKLSFAYHEDRFRKTSPEEPP